MVDVRQPGGGSPTAPLDSRRMSVVFFVEHLVTLKAICLDGSTMFDVGLDKGSRSFSHKIGDALQAHSASHLPAIFHSPHNEGRAPCAATALSRLWSPMYVSSTSTTPLSGSRLGATIARHSLWSIVQAVS